MTLAYHPAAREEARQAYLYYADIDEALALDFENRVSDAIEQITQNPESSRVRRYNVRRRNLLRFKSNYIAYMLWQDQIVIIAIGHASKRPYYWYRRPKDYRENH